MSVRLRTLFASVLAGAASLPAAAQTTTTVTTTVTTETRPEPKPVVEVAFVLDTTGSMAGLIEGAKKKIWSIATSIVEANPKAEIRMGLVAYRDIGDDYVTKLHPLSADIQGLYGELLTYRAQGGGDWPESVNEALDNAVTKFSWTSGPQVTRIVFLVGDAPPHMDYQQDRKYPAVLADARQRDIVVNAVQAGAARDTERVWRDIAQRGEGRYIPIPQDGGPVAQVETPYDREIIRLQIEINRTVMPYGSREQRAAVEIRQRQVREAPAAAASDMASYMNKRAMAAPSPAASEAVTGRGDLVADAGSGKVRLEALKDEDLPDALRGLSPTARKAALDAQAETRATLNRELAAIVARRDAHLRARIAEAPRQQDSFDRAVEDTLRVQIKR
jgi:hypothetical protein